jgi:membrane fusion protein, macrolide-specific efflux system
MKRTRLSRRRLLGGAVAATLLAGCGDSAAVPAAPPPPPPAPAEAAGPTVVVRRGDLVETIIVTARLVSTREEALFFRQGGRLKNLVVTTSDKVTAGQVMAELDIGNLGTSVAQAEIAMLKAKARLDQARATGADRFEVQLAQIDHDSAKLKYDQLEGQLQAAKLVAPFDGIIMETQGRPGEAINAFNPIVTVADPKSLQIAADLTNVNDATRLAIGQPGTIVLDKLPNVRLPVQVVQLPTLSATLANGTPTPSEISRRFKLNPLEPLPATAEIGALGRVTLVLREKKDALLIKSNAVRANGPRRFVQVIQDGRKRDIDVEVGIVTPTDTEIIAGLREGDRALEGPAPVPTMPPASRKP